MAVRELQWTFALSARLSSRASKRSSGQQADVASLYLLGRSPSGLRQTAIRCLVQLGVDGLELAAQTRLQLAAVQEYQFAFGQMGPERQKIQKRVQQP